MSDPERSLPSHPSLEQHRKQAKELLRALRGGDASVRARFRRWLPDKPALSLADAYFVLAREHGFASWAALKTQIEQSSTPALLATDFHRAFAGRDPEAVRAVLRRHPEARARINAPLFPFGATALNHFAGAGDLAMVEVLLEAGADPNRRSEWAPGGFHPLHVASGAVAERLMQAGAVPDACAAAHLDRLDLLREMLDADPARVHERGGDGQTPLHFARSRAVADLLLERGADIDARDVDHAATPAQWMLARTRGAGRYDLACYLVERGASADVFLAAALGLADRLRALLAADPALLERRTGQGDYDQPSASGEHIYTWSIGPNLTPLQVAAQFGQDEALSVLSAFADPRQRFLAACASARGDEARGLLREHPRLVDELAPADHAALAYAAWMPDAAAVALMMELGFDPAVRGHDGGTALHCACWQGSAPAAEAILRHARGRALLSVRDSSYDGTPMGWCAHGAENCRRPGADHPAVARLLLEAGAPPEPWWKDAPAAVRAVLHPMG